MTTEIVSSDGDRRNRPNRRPSRPRRRHSPSPDDGDGSDDDGSSEDDDRVEARATPKRLQKFNSTGSWESWWPHFQIIVLVTITGRDVISWLL